MQLLFIEYFIQFPNATFIKDDIEELCADSVQEAKSQIGERLTAYIQNGEDLIKILDEQGIYTYTSPSTQSVLGYEENYLIGRVFFNLFILMTYKR